MQSHQFVIIGNPLVFYFHLWSLTISWTLVASVGIAAMLFRHSHLVYYIHAGAMTFVVFFTFTAVIAQVISFGGGLGSGATVHHIVGLIVFTSMTTIYLLGFWMKYVQSSSRVKAWVVEYSRYIHAFGGLVLFVVSQMAILSAWWSRNRIVFYCLLGYQIIFLIVRTFYRLNPLHIASTAKDSQTENQEVQSHIREVSKTEDLQIYSNNYFLFNDYVYSLNEVYHNHPGGYQIISNVRAREVDRFIYGMEGIQILQSKPKFSHSRWAISLAGQPMARFKRPNPYSGMEEENQCSILSLRQLYPASAVYFLQLIPKNGGKFGYTGFQSVSQLGQYFTLTIKNKKTRLYTSVNCMNESNRKLMGEISDKAKDKMGQFIIQDSNTSFQLSQMSNGGEKTDRKQALLNKQFSQSLPLLMKRYNDGYFTSDLISSDFNSDIKVSWARGSGLALQEKKPGKIIILAGGTGIFPFIDTIDILYKKALVDQNHPMKQRILKMNPAVTDQCLNNFNFVIYASFTSYLDLHPMIFFQLNQLTKMLPQKKFSCFLKIRDYPKDTFSSLYGALKMSNERFQEFLSHEMGDVHELSQIYMCGPGKMTEGVVKMLIEKYIAQSKYTII